MINENKLMAEVKKAYDYFAYDVKEIPESELYNAIIKLAFYNGVKYEQISKLQDGHKNTYDTVHTYSINISDSDSIKFINNDKFYKYGETCAPLILPVIKSNWYLKDTIKKIHKAQTIYNYKTKEKISHPTIIKTIEFVLDRFEKGEEEDWDYLALDDWRQEYRRKIREKEICTLQPNFQKNILAAVKNNSFCI